MPLALQTLTPDGKSCVDHVEILATGEVPMFFTYPEDARWNAEGAGCGVRGRDRRVPRLVRVPRRVFQRLLPETPTPERCIGAYYLQRTRFESIAERKLRRRQLTEDGNVEISGRDLR